MFETLNNEVHIAIIGDVMLDHYLLGICERISPEAPVQVVDIKNETYSLGGAANVLENLIALKAKVSIIAVCGQDTGYEMLQKKIDGLDPYFNRLIPELERKTTIKTRVLANKHQLIRLDREDKYNICEKSVNEIIFALKQIISTLKVLVLSDYCKGNLSSVLVKQVVELCKINNVVVLVDSKASDFSKYYNVDIVKPNKKEASIATGISINDDASLKQACEKIIQITNCKTVVVTLSEEGMAIYHDGKFSKMPTKAIEVFDVTGAGDTVIASLAFGIASGMSIYEAGNFANHAAAVVVAKVGSATATLDEIKDKLSID